MDKVWRDSALLRSKFSNVSDEPYSRFQNGEKLQFVHITYSGFKVFHEATTKDEGTKGRSFHRALHCTVETRYNEHAYNETYRYNEHGFGPYTMKQWYIECV